MRELQAKRREAEKEYEKKWKEAIEKVKRYRSAPPKSVFDATRVLLRSKSKSLKIQQALKFQKLFSQHGSKSSNRRHREKQIEETRNAEAELIALDDQKAKVEKKRDKEKTLKRKISTLLFSFVFVFRFCIFF